MPTSIIVCVSVTYCVSVISSYFSVVPKEGPSPSLELVLCRTFAFLGSPLNNNRGPSILQFLQQFARYLSPHISDLWAHKLPQLINYLLGIGVVFFNFACIGSIIYSHINKGLYLKEFTKM